MKWIKANESLPEILERNYIVRQKGNSRSAHAVWWAHVHGNVEGYLKLALYDIEWLDESESPATADASVLKEALEKIIGLPDNAWASNEMKLVAQNALSQYNALPGSQGGEQDKTDMGVYENYIRETTVAQSPSPIEESGLKEGEEEINEAYVRKFLIDNRVIRAGLQEACVELLLSFHNHITKKP